jgi:hypothetical protein
MRGFYSPPISRLASPEKVEFCNREIQEKGTNLKAALAGFTNDNSRRQSYCNFPIDLVCYLTRSIKLQCWEWRKQRPRELYLRSETTTHMGTSTLKQTVQHIRPLQNSLNNMIALGDSQLKIALVIYELWIRSRRIMGRLVMAFIQSVYNNKIRTW